MAARHSVPIRGLLGTRTSPLFQGRFGRMFRPLPRAHFGTDEADTIKNLKALGDAMSADFDPPKDGKLVCRYANGVELILREQGWLPLGSCPVRFEGETGWVEAGDSGKMVLSSPALLAGRTVAEIDGYPATFHVRDFLDCVKTRSQPKGNADAACNAHIACHAANIALFLGRQLKYDLKKHEFIGDEQANRLRSEALREPWRL